MSNAIAFADIEAAHERLRSQVVRTPLVKLGVETEPEIYLKLENLQSIGAFKIRGAINAMALADPAQLSAGVWTASAGNMAQGVAWHARTLGLPCSVVVPDTAPQAKLAALERLGASIVKVTFEEWWQIIVTHQRPGQVGAFVHPVSDPAVMAGNGTIGIELAEQLPDVDAVVVPYGGGGLCTGIASALKQLAPAAKVFAAEVEHAAPLAAAMANGGPTDIDYQPSFVDGIGSGRVLDDMWPRVSEVLDGSLVSTVEQVVEAVRVLAVHNNVIAEGAGAAPVAAAMAGHAGTGKIVCIVSGGNIDAAKLSAILAGTFS